MTVGLIGESELRNRERFDVVCVKDGRYGGNIVRFALQPQSGTQLEPRHFDLQFREGSRLSLQRGRRVAHIERKITVRRNVCSDGHVPFAAARIGIKCARDPGQRPAPIGRSQPYFLRKDFLAKTEIGGDGIGVAGGIGKTAAIAPPSPENRFGIVYHGIAHPMEIRRRGIQLCGAQVGLHSHGHEIVGIVEGLCGSSSHC